MNTQPSSTIQSWPSLAPDILRPQWLYREYPQLQEIQTSLDQRFYMSVQDSLERRRSRFTSNICRLAGDEPVHGGWIMPYHPYPYPEFTQANFLRLRKQAVHHVALITALPGIKGVAGHVLPHYLDPYDAWFCLAHIVIFGSAPMDDLAAAVSVRTHSRAHLLYNFGYGSECITRFPRGRIFGPHSADIASRQLRFKLRQPDADPTQLGRFLAGLRENDLMLLRGIRQLPGGRLAFES